LQAETLTDGQPPTIKHIDAAVAAAAVVAMENSKVTENLEVKK